MPDSAELQRRPFYITTPIYYVSDVPHLGHAYTTIVADCLARYARMRGRKTGFLTGTDEHGQKIERLATEHGVTPKVYADRFAEAYKAAWVALEIGNDEFIRTTDEDHERSVADLWRQLEKSGDVYLGTYEGWYCVPCEQFYTEKELVDGACPIHKLPTEKVKEESYFFSLAKYEARLLKHIEDHPDFIQPEVRRNEVLAFIRQGLNDFSASRTTFTWGVPVPDHPRHVVYVWIDALSNYYSATKRAKLDGFWSDDTQIVHLIGKEISRFHAVYWPAMLMAAGLPLPTTIFCHGWWTVNGEKMSKTRGNVVDPVALAADLGTDALRYFVLREVPLGLDGDFSHVALLGRYKAELQNDLGNLLHRTLGMVEKYFPDRLVAERTATEPAFKIDSQLGRIDALMESFEPSHALEVIWELVRLGNTYIDKEAPWKATSNKAVILGNVLELCRVLGHLLHPFMPERAKALHAQLGLTDAPAWPEWDEKRGFHVEKGVTLFPAIDDERRAALLAKWVPAPIAAPVVVGAPSTEGQVTFEDFSRLDLRLAEIKTAEAVPKARKLLKLGVDVGDGRLRQVVAGLAETYTPDALVGKKVIFLANLRPATIRGILSEGMVLAAGDEAIVGLSTVDGNAALGTKVR